MFLVQTTKTTYLCETAEEKGKKLALTGALEVPKENLSNPDRMARDHFRAKLMGTLRNVNISENNIESHEDMPEVAALMKLYEANLPLAEQRAKARAIFKEMSRILNPDDKDDDDDDDDF